MQRISIDPQQWAELNRLLDEALDLPPADRDTWLQSLDSQHAPLKPHLRDLLARAARVETRDFLNTLPKLRGTDASEVLSGAEQVGESIGPYRLVRELGQGGMGSVWLAERTDGLLKRQVALKLPHVASRRAGLAERMAREREILATLTHPNIARLYDAGLTAEERPYLALEYVEGEPINVYCESRNLDLRARLRLFLQVANAVAYAHAKLIIHRDLKPANILVTSEGEVRLLDFGVAKLLDEGQAKATHLTELSGRALTLDYASPEQILGEPLTIATDVYSLGVVLHELLTGARPYQLKRDSRGALEDAIVQMDPARMSEAAAPVARKALRGDLDTIVLKALRKRPEDRYATVNAFADDVLRHLEHRPVLARPESFWYRTSRFVARRKLAVSLGAITLTAIIAGAGVALWQMLEAHAQRDAALAQQQRAESFSEFLSLLLQDAGSRPLTAAELLQRGTQLLERQTGMDELLVAHMYYEISRNYVIFNDVEGELALLRRSEDIASRKGDLDLLASAQCAQAWTLMNRDKAAAEELLTRALRTLDSVKSPSVHTIADCQRARARRLHANGDAEGAIAAMEAGLEAFDDEGVRAWSRKRLMRSQLSDIYRSQDRFRDALPIAEEELRFIRASGRSNTFDEIVAMNNISGNLTRVGELVESEAIQRQLLEQIEKMPSLPVQPVGLRSNYGTLKWRMGESEQALVLADTDLALAEKAGNKVNAALCDFLAARALLALGRPDESRARLERAEKLWSTDKTMFDRMLREASVHRAELHMATGELMLARELSDATLAAAGFPPAKAPGIDRILRVASRAHRISGNPGRAVELAGAALEYSRSIARDERRSADVGQAALLRAEALVDIQRNKEALQDALLAAEALKAGLGPQHADTTAAESLVKRLRGA
jgi:serine/threonine protein kinase